MSTDSCRRGLLHMLKIPPQIFRRRQLETKRLMIVWIGVYVITFLSMVSKGSVQCANILRHLQLQSSDIQQTSFSNTICQNHRPLHPVRIQLICYVYWQHSVFCEGTTRSRVTYGMQFCETSAVFSPDNSVEGVERQSLTLRFCFASVLFQFPGAALSLFWPIIPDLLWLLW
jgi:hypothetical protein